MPWRPIDRLFDIFGNATRRVIFERLARQPQSATELARGLTVTRTAIVQHLRAMEALGVLRAESQGRLRIYRVEISGLDPLLDWLSQHFKGERKLPVRTRPVRIA